MSRPADWYVLDLAQDPTPGDPVGVRLLARHAQGVSEDALRAERDVRLLAGDDAVTSWIGAAGDVFRGALDDFPTQLGKLKDSYGQAAAALAGWAGELDGAQGQADRALALGREAKARVDSLTAQLSSARSSASSASDAVSRLEGGAEPPDPDQVRAATRNAQAAASQVAALSGALGDAQGQLDAAKRMALDARELRDQAADRAGDRLHDASDAGIKPNSFWDKFKSAVAKVWEVTVKVATVVAIVVAVIALFVGGPLVWGILLVASAVLLADALMRYANGEGSLWEVGLALLGVIPGGRLLTGLGRLAGLSRIGARGVAALGRAGASLRAAAAGLRAGLGRLAVRMADDTGSIAFGAARGGDDAYRAASSGGRHAGFYKNYASKPTAEIQRGITSIEKQIAAHQAKIADPAQHIDGWHLLDPRQQQALVTKKWPSDIARQQEQLDILRGILGSR